MLETSQLMALFDRLGTPQKGRELILRARVEAPVREVRSYGGNVITFLASSKMGREIPTESRHYEFANAVIKEYDSQVLEYYVQPCVLHLELLDFVTGEIHKIQHTPDFLVLDDDGITLEEVKSNAQLSRLAERYPYRYNYEDGHWRSPQIEEKLAELGIRYRIISDEEIPRRKVENLQYLADYFHPAAEPCPETTLLRLKAALKEHGAIYIAELLAEPYAFKADELNKAIADHLVVADLEREQLTRPGRSRIFRDETLREFLVNEIRDAHVPGQDNFVIDIEVGARFVYESNELTISLLGENEVVCSQQDGKTISLSRDWILKALDKGQISSVHGSTGAPLNVARYSKEQLDVALRRQIILESDAAVAEVSARTMRRWIAKQNAALVNGGNATIALVPNTDARGNRTPRLEEQQEALIFHIIEKHWRSHEAISYRDCHRELRLACDAQGVKAPSYPTLIARIKAEETNRDLKLRHGKRMAYQKSAFIDVLYADTPPHGSRPFQYVHIDHTQLDLELISDTTGKSLGRPWLSFAIDAWSRRIVAFYLTFDAPSYHSVMMVMRDMVKRFQRLPECIVVDNGRDFMSTAFESFLQVMGVHLRFRPAGQPRHGAVLERVFGRAHTEYVHNLAGNTKATKNVRMTTGKHLPVNFAEWTLEAMYYGIQFWATEYYEQENHPALGMTPRAAFMRGLQQSGSRPQRQIILNQDFLIATCPPVDRTGTRKVNRQRGVKVNDMLYWSSEFLDLRIAGQELPVRYDPWDASSVYVRFKNRWIHAVCRNLIGLGQLTETERRAVTEEYSNRNATAARDAQAMQRLREFKQVFTPEGALALAFERQEANKSLYNTLQLGAITPVAPIQKTRLIEENPSSAIDADTRPSIADNFETPAEAQELDLPDFDEF
ncbi:putative transposase [Novimethylophilus kurashikiensis]|uniref:Putative transposase n=2 Tax=Novimethylophilus kurashikiensis TaxID=1825523 RepID=A0A2R5F369_9PROT|nr:putative transposase [Novimethylophilus kurashikiensis]